VLLLVGTVGALVTALTLLYARDTRTRLRAIEEAQIVDDMDRAVLQLDDQSTAIAATAADWAYWDDAYEYVLTGDPAFERGLDAATFARLGLHHVLFATAQGVTRFSASFADGPPSPRGFALAEPLPDGEELRRAVERDELLGRVPPGGSLTGLVPVGTDLVLYAVSEVRSTTRPDAPSAGHLFLGRIVTPDLVGTMGDRIGRTLTLDGCGGARCARTGPTVVRSDDRITATRVLTAGDGTPLAVASVTDARDLYRDGMGDVRRVLLITLTVGAGAALLGAFLTGKLVTDRLERLAAAARDVGATAIPSGRVPVEGRDEIAHVARGINQMLDALETAGTELARARRRDEAASEAKSRFIARMSHELRNPLHGIVGHAELLALDPLSPEQAATLGHLQDAARHMTAMLEEFLDTARIEAGTIPLALTATSVRRVAEEAVGLVAPAAAGRGTTVTAPASDAVAFVDPVRLQQVLLNLLSNAVKYGDGGGTVTVTVSTDQDQDQVVVAIADDGPGIAPEHLERLFVPFDRLDADDRGIGGVGIGLPVAKQLVELMGGSITVTSRVGAGSTFSLHLPRPPT